MVCTIRLAKVPGNGNSGKFALHVIESANQRKWRELRFEDERMLTCVLTSAGVPGNQQANLIRVLSEPQGEVSTVLTIPDNVALLLRD
jgi:hypothetical protein